MDPLIFGLAILDIFTRHRTALTLMWRLHLAWISVNEVRVRPVIRVCSHLPTLYLVACLSHSIRQRADH